MSNPFRRHVPATLLVACALAAPAAAHAAPASVQLRIEGRNSTTYEGPVTTDGKVVRPSSGDDRQCDGTNGNPPANPSPGATPTTALDDGAGIGGFTWDGSYNDDYDDYFITRIGPDPQTSSEFWGQYVNSQASQVGGCQELVKTGDEVLWAFDAFSKQHVLRLAGPSTGRTGQPIGVRVTDGANGAPIAGASVGGALTGADGRAALTFGQAGIYRLKATRADSVRSNGLTVCVDPAGAAPCTSTDKTPPRVRVAAGDAIASSSGRSRTVLLSWQGDDPGGSGVTGYSVDIAEVQAGVRASADVFRPFLGRTVLTRAHFRGDSGASYRFRVTGFDRAVNRASAASGVISIPVDDRDRRIVRFGRGWKRLRRSSAWGRTVMRSTRKRAVVRMRFRGRRVALVGRRLAKGGRLRVTVDGRSRVISLRGRPKFRTVLFTSRRLRAGRHTLRVATLGASPVELDAVAPLP